MSLNLIKMKLNLKENSWALGSSIDNKRNIYILRDVLLNASIHHQHNANPGLPQPRAKQDSQNDGLLKPDNKFISQFNEDDLEYNEGRKL